MSVMQVIGQADLADPVVRHLIEPASRPVLDALQLRDRYVAALWLDDVPIAAAAARIDHATRRAEIISLGCLTEYRETAALGAVIGNLRGSLNGAGLSLVFDPDEPVSEAVAASLAGGGMSLDATHWKWFEIRQEALVGTSRIELPESVGDVIDLAGANEQQHQMMHDRGQFRPHPDDVGQCSPVILGGDGQVIGFLVVRKGRPGTLLHWAWVDPDLRRRGLVLVLRDALFELLALHPQSYPVRFKSNATNREMLQVTAGAAADVVNPIFTTQMWVAKAQ